jgi:ATP-dependent RNA helicase DDX46/PRP5
MELLQMMKTKEAFDWLRIIIITLVILMVCLIFFYFLMSEYEERRKRSRDDERYSRHSGYRERDSRTEERESRSSRDLRDTIREHNGRRESDNYSSNKLERRSYLDSKELQNHSSSKEYQSRSRSRDRTNEKRHSRYSPDRRESRNSHEEKKYEKDYYNEREYIRDEGYSREYRRKRDYSTDRDQTSDYRRDHELEYTEKRRRPESVERRSRDYPVESVDVTKAASKAAEIAVKEIEEKFQKRREKMENWKKEKEKDLQEKAARVHIEEEEEQEIDLAKELKGNYPTELDVELPDFEAEKISEEKPKKKFLFGKPVKDAMGKKAITFGMTKTIVQKKLEQKTLLEDAEERDLKLKPVLEPKMDQNGVQESMQTDLAVMDIDTKVEAGIDPLDSFMEIVERERYETSIIDENKLKNQKPLNKKQIETVLLQDDPSEEDEEEFVPQIEVDQEDIMAQAAAQIQKKKELAVVDHSKMNYEPFRKNFYMEPPELAELNEEEVNQKRLDLDGIKVRGAKCPKPVEKWSQFGMPAGVHEVIKKFLKYEYPTPIQAQAIPAIMSGRDVIGIAKTGSGKVILCS